MIALPLEFVMENSSNLEPVVTTTTELVLITAEPAEPEFNYAGLDESAQGTGKSFRT
jgi:hypothetical protein